MSATSLPCLRARLQIDSVNSGKCKPSHVIFPKDSESSAWIGVGFYDKYNSLIDYASDTVSNVTEEKDITYTLKSDCSEAVKYGLFVWDGIDTMVPLQRAEFKTIIK